MNEFKDRESLHFVEVYTGEGKNMRRGIVSACDILDCSKPATQEHGFYPNLIRTCDEHAEEVILELLSLIVDDDN